MSFFIFLKYLFTKGKGVENNSLMFSMKLCHYFSFVELKFTVKLLMVYKKSVEKLYMGLGLQG